MYIWMCVLRGVYVFSGKKYVPVEFTFFFQEKKNYQWNLRYKSNPKSITYKSVEFTIPPIF
jgi:hypothetical protein